MGHYQAPKKSCDSYFLLFQLLGYLYFIVLLLNSKASVPPLCHIPIGLVVTSTSIPECDHRLALLEEEFTKT